MEIVQQRTPRETPRKKCRSCGTPIRWPGLCQACRDWTDRHRRIAAHLQFLAGAAK